MREIYNRSAPGLYDKFIALLLDQKKRDKRAVCLKNCPEDKNKAGLCIPCADGWKVFDREFATPDDKLSNPTVYETPEKLLEDWTID